MTGYALCTLAVVLVLGWAWWKGRAEWAAGERRAQLRRIIQSMDTLYARLGGLTAAAKNARVALERLARTLEEPP